MKNKLKIICLTFTCLLTVMPVVACTFDHYADKVRERIMHNLAEQTSMVAKSLILGKEKNADTGQLINDMFRKEKNVSIENKTNSSSINSWADFEKQWGENSTIKTNITDKDNYIIKKGEGKLTNEVNKREATNNLFDNISWLTKLGIVDNSILSGFVLDKNASIRSTISNLITELKQTNPEKVSGVLTFLKNSIVGSNWSNTTAPKFEENVINPLKMLFNNLIDKDWNLEGKQTPNNYQDLKAFMESWKDDSGNYYSNWVDDAGKWNLGGDSERSEGYTKDWNNIDYNFYRAGAILSHLFYKIGEDYQLYNPDSSKKPDYRKRYLGDIISDHINSSYQIDDFLMKDLQQYLAKIIKNPLYILDLIQAIVPIVKQFIVKIPDFKNKLLSLSIGNIYPRNTGQGNFNLSDLLTNIKELLNNNELKLIIESILSASKNPTAAKSFLFDVKIKKLEMPLPLLISAFDVNIDGLVNKAVNFLTSDSVKATISNISELFSKWVEQYNKKGKGIKFNLRDIASFLIGTNNNESLGILNVFNTNVVKPNGSNNKYGLFNMITDTNKNVSDDQYEHLYLSLGGRLKENNSYPKDFKPGSVIELLEDNISDNNKPLGKFLEVLYGNADKEKNIAGVSKFITNSNNEWIKKNYTDYFDITNTAIAKLSNIKMTTKKNNEFVTNYLSYEISYNIDGKISKFLIQGVINENIDKILGTRSFYFQQINKI